MPRLNFVWPKTGSIIGWTVARGNIRLVDVDAGGGRRDEHPPSVTHRPGFATESQRTGRVPAWQLRKPTNATASVQRTSARVSPSAPLGCYGTTRDLAGERDA
jgi:hypothetical protein